ncbi:hypothetical protein E2C01_017035 [Portunus trituberculatus]|uniref:Uncharacterized protein n=1 Tax=Portunus trituberculatus TaxID=210409 RepID=A0A5B7DRV8_PORTR|nr:hypothetical protein [Portunus trituberculatus]
MVLFVRLVILMVLVASTTAVSPPGPSCRLRLRQPLPQPPTYRPPYSPASYYPSTGGMWVCYTSYGYGGSVPYPYGSRPGYWPYGAAVATPVAATAPVPSAATATPIAVAPAAPPSIPYPAAARVAPTPVVAYPYYGGATQAQPVAFPYPYPGRLLATVVYIASPQCMGPFSVLNWMQMAGCVSSGRGEQLFTAATKRLNLLVPGPQNAPIVAFNQEVVIADASALELFPTLLCQQLTQVPEASTFCSYNTLY